jgi:hypothetical protein
LKDLYSDLLESHLGEVIIKSEGDNSHKANQAYKRLKTEFRVSVIEVPTDYEVD